LSLLRPILLCLLLAALILGWSRWRDTSATNATKPPSTAGGTTIIKQPANFTNRMFDPSQPPSEMPPLTSGENAECESEFSSNASIGGQRRQKDATHATVTVTQIKMTLQLNITIWTPVGVSQHVMEHEEGHRQISEYYYQTADKLAERIAGSYIGKQVEITGTDLNAESNNALQQMAAEITEEYGRELNSEPTQLLYDTITDHSRNGVAVQDAVDHAIKNIGVESAPTTPQ